MKQEIYVGRETHKKVRDILQEYSPKKVFFVTGKDSYISSKTKELIGPMIDQGDHVRFSEFEANPRVEDLQRGIELFRKEHCDFVVGAGGGSVMDLAKAVSLLSTQDRTVNEVIEGYSTLKSRRVPAVMIPTTAGTGSESTQYAVVNKGKNRYSITHESLVPDVAILDPIFSEQAPAYLTACTGMDVLCQGIEAFWSFHSTVESREYSRKAIHLAISNLNQCVNDPDEQVRENMLIASNCAGKAINITQTTIAHAVSYPITSYFGVAHGHAVALTLPHFIEFNGGVTEETLHDQRGLDYVIEMMRELNTILGVETSEQAKQTVLELMSDIQLETHLSQVGIKQKDLDTIVQNGFSPQRANNNPRKVTTEDLRKLLAHVCHLWR